MSVLTCPLCGVNGEPAVRIATIAICASCGVSLATDAGGDWRRASNSDTADLSAGDLQMLQKARGKIARPGKKQT